MENEGTCIFIVDEDKGFLSTLTHKLSKSIGTTVLSFSSVAHCLQKMKTTTPDMIYVAANTKGATLLHKEVRNNHQSIPIFNYSTGLNEPVTTMDAQKQLHRKARILRVAVKKAISRMKHLKEKKEEQMGKRRIIAMIFFCVLSVALTMWIYPSALPWLIGFFLVIGTISVFFGERMTTH